ncbi:MAG: glycosyltransferase family 39 protein [Bacteroidales bacterium]|nr:glycosyltransferase family 39 protein [Bacteroidales bacterium]
MNIVNGNIGNLVMLVTTIVSLGLSILFLRKSKHSLSLLLLIFAGLILRITISSDQYLHPHDEKYHALVAKNLIDHPLKPTLYENPIHKIDYTDWSCNHIWLHKQPLPLWCMAVSIYILGNNEFAVRTPSIILSCIAIWLIYQISLFFFKGKSERKTAWIAALLMTINGLVLELTGGRIATDHYDIFFMFFILAGIYFSAKHVISGKRIYSLLIGLSIGLAILTKWLPALIVIPIWLMIAFDSKKFSKSEIILNLLVITAIATAVFLPWQLYIYSHFPTEASYTASYNIKHFTEVLDNQTGEFWFYLARMGTNYGELIFLPLIFILIRYFKNKKDFKLFSLIIWIFIPLIFFSIAKTKMQAYILFIAPALFIISAWFVTYLTDKAIDGKHKFIDFALAILIIVLPIRYSIERIKPFSAENKNPDWVQTLKKLNNSKLPKNTLLFNHPYPIEAMFYLDCTAYSSLPPTDSLSKYYSEGYNIIIYNQTNVPEEILNVKDYQILYNK